MRPRTTNESKPVGLFPFLAVLLCTMGALLVLLVVLAQRAGEHVAAQQAEPLQATEPQSSGPSEPIALQEPETLPDNDIESVDLESNDLEAEDLAEQLAKAHAYQVKLSKLREQAAARLDKEQLRLSHLEEHARRIEHELARLAIAVKQLEATEKNQTVDQQQAESELVHLKELIKETEEQLEKLRDESEAGHRSYAIVPYKGPNGTYRRPVYIECSKEGVTIQPEGIRFTGSDFTAPGWPGNPLAAALRASREYLNAKAAQAGQPEPPDPYPLLIVRPDGITQYQVARTALAAWDADFGYEFVDSDWDLEFPDLPDPRLAQIQHHAQLTAREQLSRLIRSAPSRFRGIGGLGGSSSMSAGGTSGSQGYGAGGQSSESNDFGALAQSADGKTSGGGSAANGQSLAEAGTAAGDFQHGALSGDSGGDGSASQNNSGGSDSSTTFAELSTSNEGTKTNASGGEALGGEGNQAPGAGTESSGLAQTASQSGGGSSAGGSSSTGSSSGGAAAGTPPSGPTGDAPSLNMSNQNIESIAESRGKNWAVSKKSRGALPIRRPIQVVVREDRIALLPSRHATEGIGATGSVISLNQPTRQVSDEFVEALKTRVDQWGLAGNGLYWRPVLELHIGPEAEGTARGIAKLLLHSGVEVHRSETAATGSSNQALKGDLDRATR